MKLSEQAIKAGNQAMMNYIKLEGDHPVEKFWRKLNNAPIEVYLRFQRMFACKHAGQWIRGISLNEHNELGFVLE